MTKLYRNYDDDFIYDSSNYGKHVSAMTGEQLHSKSDIAAELAYRDDLIEKLQHEVDQLRSVLKECDEYLDYNKYTTIGNGSALHRSMKNALKEPPKESNDE